MLGLSERFAKKIEVITESGCWIWMGALSSNGYGNVHMRPIGNVVAHRIVYQEVRGFIPDGLDLDHLCRVRCCVNPYHLEPVSRFENLRRGGVIDRLLDNAKNMHAVTHCKRGHEMTPENSYTYPNGKHRQCRTCMREYQRNWIVSRKKAA